MLQLKLEELQMILEGINQNSFATKHSVREQILHILNGPHSILKKKLEQQILQIHLSKLKDMQHPLRGRVKRIKKLLKKYRYNSILSNETTNETIRFAHNLPFFRTIHSISDPIHCKGNNFSTFMLTNLYHEIQNIQKYIKKSWDSKRKEYKIQIILRLEQVGNTTIVNGSLPSNIHVSVNNYDSKLPKLIIQETGNTPPWRLNIPINITDQINFNKYEGNTLKITWSNDPRTYIAGVFLSEKLTSEDLLIELKKRCLRRSDITKEFIKNSLKNNDDMSVDSFIVTLKDPLTTQIMKIPARGKECKHLQCFDAIKFLQMNEQKETWACPICKKQVKFDDIEVDEFFRTILRSKKLSKGSENVILFNDGTWAESKTKIYTSSNNKEIILIDSDEDNMNENVDIEEWKPKSKRFKYNPPKEKIPKHIAETVEVIKKNVNSSTKCDLKNDFAPSGSDNLINKLNDIPGPSSSRGSNYILNNFSLPNNTNLVNIDDSVKSKDKKNEKKINSVICVITLD
ncbi:hypothetical protein QTP88_020744 [Uroleucon formosanum]